MTATKITWVDKNKFAAPPANMVTAENMQEVKAKFNQLVDDVAAIPGAPGQLQRIINLETGLSTHTTTHPAPTNRDTRNEAVGVAAGLVNPQIARIDTLFLRTVNVKDYGAKGDGITDDTAALQLAFNEAGRVFVPAGTYIISDTLKLKSNTELFGDSWNSIIKLAAATDKDLVRNINYSTPGVDVNIYIHHIALDGSWSTNTVTADVSCLRFRYVNKLTIEMIEASQVSMNGITALRCDSLDIFDCHLHHIGATAVNFRLCDYASICYNRIHNVGSKTDEYGVTSAGHGIADFASGTGEEKGSYNVKVTNNIVYNMGDSCLRNNNGRGWTISDNIVVGGGKDSIKMMMDAVGDPLPEYNIIANNIIVDAGNDGIVYNGENGIISGNFILGTGKNAAGSAHNKFFPNSCAGIQIGGNGDNVYISDNIVIDAFRTGIRITRSGNKNIFATDNTVLLSGEDGFRLTNSNNTYLINNRSYNNQQGRTGHSMSSGSGIRVSNTASVSGLVIRGNYLFDDQTVATQLYGFYAQDTGGNTQSKFILEDNVTDANVTNDIISAYTPTQAKNNTNFAIMEQQITATNAISTLKINTEIVKLVGGSTSIKEINGGWNGRRLFIYSNEGTYQVMHDEVESIGKIYTATQLDTDLLLKQGMWLTYVSGLGAWVQNV